MGKQLERAEWTGFQESRPYGPKYDLRTDFVMVYGLSDQLEERIEGWRKAGYTIHLMTGVSWGEYQDYLYEKFDGRNHWDEAQMDRFGNYIQHGKDVPYMDPTIAFSEYLATYIKKAIDCGVEAIHLEEPEYWAASGYSEAFKREWLTYYGEPWTAPHLSPDAQYRASKLKAYLYYRALDRLCAQMKEYALVTYNRQVRFYVPTHSLINYTQWRIISPEALLVSMPSCDGFIAQIWTGTSRTPNVYRGIRRERTFETAFLEYGVMQELTRGTGRDMWFLHDPIEDNPRYSWSDYRYNYRATVVASLLHPGVSKFEVCPWPWRVFTRGYPTEDGTGKEGIPASYKTVLLTVMNVLRDLHHHEEEPTDVYTSGIGLLLSNSAMYQRGDVLPEEPEISAGKKEGGVTTSDMLSPEQRELLDFSAFYGLALPLVKHGIPLRPVQLDNALTFPGYLDDYKVLLLSYEFMKPEHAGLHQAIAGWVRDGGVLIYVGDGTDAFHGVREWWNREGSRRSYERPDQHLFETLGLAANQEDGEYAYGDGFVIVRRVHPAALSRTSEGADSVRDSVQLALKLRGETEAYRESGMLRIKRGPYVIAQALDETEHEGNRIDGMFIDLFEDDLPILNNIELKPGSNCLLYDLETSEASGGNNIPRVLVSSSRIEDETAGAKTITFRSESPSEMTVSTRLRAASPPTLVTADGLKAEHVYDEASGTLLVRYPGKPEGVLVKVAWG